MAHDPSASVDLTVEPDLDARHAVSFPLSRRGYDPHQVDHVLHELAAEVEGLRATVVELREREADLLVALDMADDRTRAAEVRAEQLEAELASVRDEVAARAATFDSTVDEGAVGAGAVEGTAADAGLEGTEALQVDDDHHAGPRTFAEAPTPSGVTPDVAAMVGEETVRIVEAARHAAVEIGARAREDGERVVAEAREEARVIRADAEVQLLNRTREADDAVAARLLEAADAVQEAEARAEAIVADGFTEAATLVLRAREDAEATVAAGEQQAQELITAAKATRDDLLTDLVSRRKVLRRQVEQLEAGRVRIRAAYEVVETSLAETTAELDRTPVEARDAALAAAAHADQAPDPELVAAVAELGADPTIVTGPAASEPVAATADEPAPAPSTAVETSGATETDDGPVASPIEPAATAEPADEPAEPVAPTESDPATEPVSAVVVVTPVDDVPVGSVASAEPVAVEPGRRRRRRAPDPVEFEGRWSSAVRVLPPGAETAEDPGSAPTPEPGGVRRLRRTRSASDVFARLRADEAHQPSLFDGAETADSDPEADHDVSSVATDADGPTAPHDDVAAPVAARTAEAAEASADLESAWVERRDAAVAPALRALRRRLKATLADDEDALLEAIRRSEPVPESVDSLRDARARRDDLALALQTSLATAAAAGAELVASDPAVRSARAVADGADPATVVATIVEAADLEPIARQLADEVVGPLDERLERNLARYHRSLAEADDGSASPNDEGAASEQGRSADHEAATAALVSSVKAAYRARRGVQVQVPTEDAVLRAGHRGLVASLEPGTPLRWVVVAPAEASRRAAGSATERGDAPGTSGAAAGCPSCVAVADVGAGDRFGHGPVLPPARPGCRCAIAPVVAVVPRRP